MGETETGDDEGIVTEKKIAQEFIPGIECIKIISSPVKDE